MKWWWHLRGREKFCYAQPADGGTGIHRYPRICALLSLSGPLELYRKSFTPLSWEDNLYISRQTQVPPHLPCLLRTNRKGNFTIDSWTGMEIEDFFTQVQQNTWSLIPSGYRSSISDVLTISSLCRDNPSKESTTFKARNTADRAPHVRSPNS